MRLLLPITLATYCSSREGHFCLSVIIKLIAVLELASIYALPSQKFYLLAEAATNSPGLNALVRGQSKSKLSGEHSDDTLSFCLPLACPGRQLALMSIVRVVNIDQGAFHFSKPRATHLGTKIAMPLRSQLFTRSLVHISSGR